MYSCSVSNKQINNAEARIKKLSQQGVPDSALAVAKVFVYQTRSLKEDGSHGLARNAADSMQFYIAKAEETYKQNMERLTPWIQQERAKINEEIASLTGLNRKHADSIVAVIDSFVQINWLLQAEERIKKFEAYIPQLKFDQSRGEEIRPRVLGTWTMSDITKNDADKSVHAVKEYIFNFKQDGTGSLIQRKKGKSSPLFKEDWEFISYGKYDFKGDTIYLIVNRFETKREDFWEYKTVSGDKKDWVKTSHPIYDSSISDGSQNRFVLFETLREDYKFRP